MGKLNRRVRYCACNICGTIMTNPKRRFAYGHAKIPSQICACGKCGLMTNPGRRYINGHGKVGKKTSPETIEKIRIASTGRVCKEETKEILRNQVITDEKREKARQSATGRKQSPETIEKRRQKMLGRVCLQEKKDKIRVKLTGVKHPLERVEANSQCHLQYYQDHPEALLAMSEQRKGPRSSFYVDGRCSGENYEYPVDFNERLKELIRDRDGHQCQLCLIEEKDCNRKLDVHHIDYDKENCDPKNLISLCHKCHPKTNHHRDKWIVFFQSGQPLTLVQRATG